MLGTGAVMANEVLVTCIQPLQPGDERYAVSFAIPLNAPGLKILSRRSYEREARSVFDNPVSSRYDENDALLYFDDVKVPWERVFVAGDLAMCQKQFHATPAHVYQNYQAQIRLMVKLKFLAGLAHRTATLNGIAGFPQVREALGQIAADVGMVEGLVYGMEARGRYRGEYFVPDAQTLYTAQVLSQQLYPRLITALRDLAGGGLIMLPSSIADFASPSLRALIEKTQQSPAADSYERVKFYKLAWDAIGSEFGSRHTQYEMFYAGATFVTKGHAFRCYDWQAADSAREPDARELHARRRACHGDRAGRLTSRHSNEIRNLAPHSSGRPNIAVVAGTPSGVPFSAKTRYSSSARFVPNTSTLQWASSGANPMRALTMP
jgi:4-hydroxyphenylacetate 3-monooxygenase